MGGFRDAVKIIDKTPAELEQIKADVKKAGLPEETVTVILYGLNLILVYRKLKRVLVSYTPGVAR